MDLDGMNQALLAGNVDGEGVFPRLDALAASPFVFRTPFGLDELPTAPGLIFIRGPRQYGKSTWLEACVRDTVREFGAGTALFLDGDHLRDGDDLAARLGTLSTVFRKDASVRRLFVDEITAVPDWTRALKRVVDRGELRNVLVVTTGSRATDLRRGTERLPGRKGRLARTAYLFAPIPFGEFERVAGDALGRHRLAAYVLSGGSPPACVELAGQGRLPPWLVEATRDWILGECALSGRPRRSLVAVMEQLHRHGGTPLGQTKLARDAGLANNTVAAGYIELLADLLCVGTSAAWDPSHEIEVARKPAKFPFINLLAALAWSAESPRSPGEFGALQPERQGIWLEWLVAQELYRRAAISGHEDPERIPHWRSDNREVDFVRSGEYFEVKRGRSSALEHAWFPKAFPAKHLTVISARRWETDWGRSVTMEDFLRERDVR